MKNKSQTVLSLGQMKDLASAMVQGIPANLDTNIARYWIGHKKELAGEIRGVLISKTNEDWLQEILNREYECHFDFFGCNFDLLEFQITLEKYGQKKINKWKKLGLEPHFLPEVVLSQNNNLSGWKVKPEDWYFQIAAEGRILRNVSGKLMVDKEPFKLEGITVLVDVRLKPSYNAGKQMYENDNLLGSIIKQFRRDGKIAECESGPQPSRFGVSADKWENQIKPLLSARIGLGLNQVRLERAIETNVFPQLYPYMSRKDDGNTNTWVWYEEYFASRVHRLAGGNSDYGGLAHVDCHWPDRHWAHISVRPLAVL